MAEILFLGKLNKDDTLIAQQSRKITFVWIATTNSTC
jgi:hypothetical protein